MPHKISSINTDSSETIQQLKTQLSFLNKGLASLYQATEEVKLSKPLPVLLKSMLKGLRNGASISKAAIFLPYETENQFKNVASIGLKEKKIQQQALVLKKQLLNNGLIKKEAQKTITQFVKDVFQIPSIQWVPLLINESESGLLFYNLPSYQLTEMVPIFAKHISLTISHAKLFEDVEQIALRDSLTGLYNRRHVKQIVDYELNRAKRYHQPLSIVFIDLDHFKEINDTFGHTTGDRFLKLVSQKLSTLFRNTDVLGRWAGDEFLAVLPNTPPNGALILSNRLHQSIADYSIPARGKNIKISISIGIQSYNGNNSITSSELIDQADQAMYQAKSSGRNQTKFFM